MGSQIYDITILEKGFDNQEGRPKLGLQTAVRSIIRFAQKWDNEDNKRVLLAPKPIEHEKQPSLPDFRH